MKVSLTSACSHHPFTSIELSQELVFKVYDRRFAPSLRKFYGALPLTYEAEARYQNYVASGNAPQGLKAIHEEKNTLYAQGTDEPPELTEHLLATNLPSYFDNECAVYNRLASLQGQMIPSFYGATSFLNSPPPPGLDVSVRGILVEFVPGVNLCHIDPLEFNLETLIPRAIHIVDVCGDMGVLNHDVRMENFIARPGGSELVMIDFAQSRLRGSEESDEEWREAKWSRDEEGAIGYTAQKQFDWKYVPSHKYIGPPEDVVRRDVATVRAMLEGLRKRT